MILSWLLFHQIEKDQEDSEAKVSILGLFRSPSLRRPLLISIVMQLSQQLCGINGVSWDCHLLNFLRYFS